MAKQTADGKRRLYLVDGTAQLFRAYFAIRNLTNADGLPTNAVFGFTTMLRKMLEDEKPDAIAVAFDLPGKVFRHDDFPDYKANRPPAPEDLNVQMPYAKQVCEALGVPVVELDRYEADDLIATYARQAVKAGWHVTVVASDKDLLQLVEADIDVLNPSKDLRLDPAGVKDSFGVAPEFVRDVLGLQGDSVDNIPGVPGVGGKTAVQMVGDYGGVEPVIERAERFVAFTEARDRWLELLTAAEKEKELVPDPLLLETDTLLAAGDLLVAGEPSTDYGERVAAALAELRSVDMNSIAGRAGQAGRKSLAPLKEAKKSLKGLEKGSQRKIWFSVLENREQAILSKQLATLHEDVPETGALDLFEYTGPNREAAYLLFKSLGFGRLTTDFAEGEDAAEEPSFQLTSPPGPKAAKPAKAAAEDVPSTENISEGESSQEVPKRIKVEIVLERKALADWIKRLRKARHFALDTETDSTNPMQARLVGLSFACEKGEAAYLPIAHDYLGAPEQLPLAEIVELLGGLFADAAVTKVGQNFKYDAHVLRRHNLPVEGWSLDTMVAAFLLNPGRLSYSMDHLAAEFLQVETVAYSDLAGKGAKQKTLNEINVERVGYYAGEDAEVTLALGALFEERLREQELDTLYATIDGPVLPILIEMEAEGIRVDAKVLDKMSGEMGKLIETSREAIFKHAGTEFNVDSPKQLRVILFDKLALKPRKKTAKGGVASTDAQTLDELRDDHPIAEKILDYRELTKLKSTYVDTLPKLIHPETGRVHTSYHATGAATGRLSSSDPNLQNIPARTPAGRKIRAAFVPKRGYRFLASDYSQVELRVLAHMAEDPTLIEAFNAGEDIHRYTASKVFGVPLDQVDRTMRTRAKAVNFGILYGMSETRLAREQGMKRGEARHFIQKYFERFGRVREYIDGVRDAAIRDAAVRTLFGRIRWFPQLHQGVHRGIQEQNLRAALNTTIQGTAADLMKMAMIAVHRALAESNLRAKMLLQVHDELLFEVHRDDLEATSDLVRGAMESVYPLAVPLSVDQKQGKSWLDVT